MADNAPQTFAGNCQANQVPASSQRYICPLGPNATLQTDPDLAEIIIQEDTEFKNFSVKTTSAQPTGNTGLRFQLVKNGSVLSELVVATPGEGANVNDADFPNGPHKFKIGDRLCIGVLNTSTSASARIGAFALG